MLSRISIALIGRGSMLQICAEIAQSIPQAKITNAFVKSRPDDTGQYLRGFFQKRNVECVVYRDISTVKDALSKHPERFNLLVSVYNDDRLDVDLLKHFAMAVNFHPSPLPRYAGVAPESWAILGGEAVHGVTWHVVGPEFDAGEILAQELFELHSTWTAYDLSVECTKMGCRLFKSLLMDLVREDVSIRPQDLSKRTYFGQKLVPFDGRFPFLADFQVTERLRRATAYFPMQNTFCIPRVTVDGVPIGLVRFTVHSRKGTDIPGEIVNIDESGVIFATADGLMRATLILIPGGTCIRSTDPTALSLLPIGACASVDTTRYDAMGLRKG